MKVNELFEEAKRKDLVGFDCRTHISKSSDPTRKWVENYFCDNLGLTSLKGAPKTVERSFNCTGNKLTSLEFAPKEIGLNFNCARNDITSLHNIHKMIDSIKKRFVASSNPISSHVLGLLKIKQLTEIHIDNKDVQNIINKYLPEGNIVDCQQELIEAGFEEYAQL